MICNTLNLRQILPPRTCILAGLFVSQLFTQSLLAEISEQSKSAAELADTSSHRLLPGIVGRGVSDTNWTRTQHDALATGFSPLVCGMKVAPIIWAEKYMAGTLISLEQVDGPQGAPCLLVNDGQLRLIDALGQIMWSRSPVGNLIGSGDLRGDGGQCALFAAGPTLILLDLENGKEIWRHVFEPNYVSATGKIADILVDRPGLEAAIVFIHGEEGCLISFSAGSLPEIVWQRKLVTGEFNERYDHYNGTIELDLSLPDRPLIWNLRRHRCTGIDARTGDRLSSVTYDIGGSERRNYGPMYLGRGLNGDLYACVFGQGVQIHTHAIRLYRDRDNVLAWQHFYGEVYKEAPGVALEAHGLLDVDADGSDEMVYSVRDPANGFRSFVRARSVETGEIKFELPDQWGLGIFSDIGPEKSAGLVSLAAPKGQIPRHGDLSVHCVNSDGTLELAGKLVSAGFWGPPTVPGDQGDELLLREQDSKGALSLSRFITINGKLQRVSQTCATELLEEPISKVIHTGASNDLLYLTGTAGQLRAFTWDGKLQWSRDLQGNVASAISAADLDKDGRAELIAATPDKRLRVFSCDSDGTLKQRLEFQHLVGWHCHHPVIYDLQGNGQLCLLTAGSNDVGQLVIRAYHPDGTTLWETPLAVTASDLRSVILNAGQFLAKDHAGLAVSMTDSRLVHEGTYMLDGLTGEVLWSKGLYRDGGIVMPYRPNGIPTAYDFNRDGVEEIGMDMLSYMAYLKGSDGEFVHLLPTHNIRSEGAVYAGHLYNTYCPLLKQIGDLKPHWFVTAGFGPFGLINPDFLSGVWKEDLDYDVPRNIALVDVDGDGELEAGYAAMLDTKFICRNAWSGAIEWTLDLPTAPNAATITADFDGDGRGEFYSGQYCIGVNADGKGEIEWQAPVHITWPVIADFDGDGQGEIAGSSGGRIVVLNSK